MTASSPQLRPRARAYQVFISSTFLDLSAERKAVCDVLSDLNAPLAGLGVCLIPVDLQGGADTEPPLDVCLRKIEQCDLVVTLLGHRAGWLSHDGRSITECEFDHAHVNGIPCLAYVRDASVPVLPEFVDKDEKHVTALNRLRQKVDESVKRDAFRSTEHLRGHILRDVMSWVFSDSGEMPRLAEVPTMNALAEIKKYWEALRSGDVKAAVEVVRSRRFTLDMRRFGTEFVHRELLQNLLELDTLATPTLVTTPHLRSQMLLQFLFEFSNSIFASAALAEAKELEEQIDHPTYSFNVARAEGRLHRDCGKALPALKRMLRYARATGDPHCVAEGRRAVGDHYSHRRVHSRARRWYWLSIEAVCRMQEICPHCLGAGFLGLADQTWECQDCRMTDNAFLKAYLIGQVIPDREMQIRALLGLSSHRTAHNELDESVACAVLAARLAKEARPRNEESGLPAMLANLIAENGRSAISEATQRVGDNAGDLLKLVIDRYQLNNFVRSLGLRPSSAGDHW